MNTWVSKDDAEHHYHTGHRSICGISDILQDMATTHHTAENPKTKCKTCMGILTSKGFFKINLDKNRNNVHEAKFLQKYRESTVGMLTRYLAAPENHKIMTMQKIRQELEGTFDGINVLDVLSMAIVSGDVKEKNGNFYPKCREEIVL